MNVKSPQKLLLIWLCVAMSITLTFVVGLSVYDFQGYKYGFHQLQESEKDKISSEINQTKDSAQKLFSLILSRIEASRSDRKRIQKVLSSVGQLAAQVHLPLVLNVQYIDFSKPAVEVSRFGIRPLRSSPPLGHSFEPQVLLTDSEFQISQSIPNNSGKPKSLLIILFNREELQKRFANLHTLALTSSSLEGSKTEIEGLDFTFKFPMTFWSYVLLHASLYGIFSFFAFLMLLTVAGLYIFLRQMLGDQYKEQVGRLTNEVTGFVESEFRNQSYRTTQQTLRQVRSLLLHRQKEQLNHIHTVLGHVGNTYSDSNSYEYEEENLQLLDACSTSLESVALGFCSPLEQKDVSVSGMMDFINDLFADKLHENEVTFQLDCPDELTVRGDYTFMLLILVNTIGKSIFRVLQLGQVVVEVTSDENMTSFEISDTGAPLNTSTEKMISDAFELFIDDRALKSLSDQVGITFETERIPDRNLTIVTIPLQTHESTADNVVQLFQ